MKLGVWLAVAAATVLVVGCGAVDAQPRDSGEPAGTLEPAPPIEAVDEPATPLALTWLDREEDGEVVFQGTTVCSVAYASDSPSDDHEEAVSKPCEDLSPEERAQLEEADRAFRALVEPAPGSVPRTIAKLALAGDRVVSLVAWRSTSGRLCVADEVSTGEGGGGGGGPGGPCLGEDDPSCSASLCLDSGGHGPPMRWTLVGVVSSEGEELRITFDSGALHRYPLSGPLVPGFREYRVFLLDLGLRDYSKLELLRAGVVVAAYDVPPWLARMRDCTDAEPDDRPEECGPGAE